MPRAVGVWRRRRRERRHRRTGRHRRDGRNRSARGHRRTHRHRRTGCDRGAGGDRGAGWHRRPDGRCRPGGARGRLRGRGQQGQPDRPARRVGQLQGHPRRASARSTPTSSTRSPRPTLPPGRRWKRSRRSPVRTTCPTVSTSARPSPKRWSTPVCSSRTSRPSIDEIPPGLVDVDNNWTAAYYGIMAISTNTTIVENAPKTFADLKKPEYEGLVALNGDPREAGAGVRRRHGGVDRQRRQRRRHHAGHRVLRRAQGVGQPRWHRRHPGDRAVGRDADRHRLELQRAGSGRSARRSRPHGRDQLPDRRRVRRLLRPGCGQRTRRTRPARSSGSSTSSPTRVRSATSRVVPMPARYEALVEAGLVDEAAKVNLPPDDLISQVEFLTPSPDRGRGRGPRLRTGARWSPTPEAGP